MDDAILAVIVNSAAPAHPHYCPCPLTLLPLSTCTTAPLHLQHFPCPPALLPRFVRITAPVHLHHCPCLPANDYLLAVYPSMFILFLIFFFLPIFFFFFSFSYYHSYFIASSDIENCPRLRLSVLQIKIIHLTASI